MSGSLGPSMGHNSASFAMNDMFTADAEQRVWSFFTNQVAEIENEVFRTQYPDIQYPQLIPVDFSAPEWAQVITYASTDAVGQAQWFHANGHDVPLVAQLRNVQSTTIQMAAIGYKYNLEELAIAMRLGSNLNTDLAAAARRGAEEFVERVAFFGDTSVGMSGLINNSAVTAGSVAADGTGSTTTWSTKTGDQIIRDINAILSGIWTSSNTVETADTLLLPLTQFNLIATTRVAADIPMTILEWLRRNNAYTATTGNPLTIRSLPRLNDAGSGGTARMVAYRRAPDVVKLHIPMPFRFLPPQRTAPLVFEVPGIVRVGGVDIRRPGAFRYADGL